MEEAEEAVEVEQEWISPLVYRFFPPCSVYLVTASLRMKIAKHCLDHRYNKLRENSNMEIQNYIDPY